MTLKHPYPHGRTFQDCEDELKQKQAEIEGLRGEVTKYKARMQVMRNYLTRYSGPSTTLWRDFCRVRPEAAEWFDEEGVPR